MGIVIRQSIWTSVFSYLGIAIGYINLLVLYPKFLHLEQVGLLRTVLDAAILMAPFAQFGLAQSIARFFPHFSGDLQKSNGFITLILLISLVTFGLFLLIYFQFQNTFFGWFDDKAGNLVEFSSLILWLAFTLMLTALFEQFSRSTLKVAVPAFLREIGIRLLQALMVSLYFTGIVNFSQFLIGSVSIYGLTLVILIIYMIMSSSWKPSFNFTGISVAKRKEILLFGALSFVGTSSMVLIGKMDSLMVTAMLGFTSNAIYTTAFYMATVIEVPKRAITAAASTLIANAFEKQDLRTVSVIYKKTSINQLIIGALLLIGVWANIENMFALMPRGDEYRAGMYVVLIVGSAKLLDMLFGPSSEIIGLSALYWFNLVVITLLAALIVITNYLFIPRYGIEGAAGGTLLALTTYNLAKFIFIYLKFQLQPFTINTLKVILISGLVVAANLALPHSPNVVIDIIYRSFAITLLFGGLILATKCSEDINHLFSNIIKK